MIASLMIYAFAVALLIALAGLALEKLTASRSWPRRGIWAAALLLSLVYPALRVMLPHHEELTPGVVEIQPAAMLPPATTVAAASAPVEMPSSASSRASQTRHAKWAAPVSLESDLRALWIGGSSGLLLFYAMLWLRLRLARRLWCRDSMNGQEVWVTEALGPAVYGCLRARILLPKWVFESPDGARSLILAHEREHIAAGDPWLLLLGLIVVAAAPWNLPLWWQLRRLRFAIEVDCDRRVLRAGVEPRAYGEMLLAVGQRRTLSPLGAIALIEPASQLLRRVRIMAGPRTKGGRLLVGATLLLSLACLAGAIELEAPDIDAASTPRKLPELYEYDLTKPTHFGLAEAAARAKYPEVFDGQFDGSVEVAVGLDRSGALLGVEKRVHPAGPLVKPFLEPHGYASSWAQMNGFESQDVLEHYDYLFAWHGPFNANKLYLTYDVIKWPHDPARSVERVRKAVLMRYPEMLQPDPDGKAEAKMIAVFMNDDGTINRSIVSPDNQIHPDKLFEGIGLRSEDLGHRGRTRFWTNLDDPMRSKAGANSMVYYAWPRRASDPPDSPSGRDAYSPRIPNQDPSTDALIGKERDTVDRAIVKQYFPNFWLNGVSPQELLYVLLDRHGEVCGTAQHNREIFGGPANSEFEARFPGIQIGYATSYDIRSDNGHKAQVWFSWPARDSPVTTCAAVDLSKRKDLFVLASVFEGEREVQTISLSLTFGIPATSGMKSAFRVQPHSDIGVELTAIEATPDAVELRMRLRQLTATNADGSEGAWFNQKPIARVAYGQEAAVQVNDDMGQSWRIVLRPRRLDSPKSF
jgi:beta-lactamase regulating signal transducer with metallopeptidase domain